MPSFPTKNKEFPFLCFPALQFQIQRSVQSVMIILLQGVPASNPAWPVAQGVFHTSWGPNSDWQTRKEYHEHFLMLSQDPKLGKLLLPMILLVD